MKLNTIKWGIILSALSLSSFASFAADSGHGGSNNSHASSNTSMSNSSGPACTGFGPQTPRDIDARKGTNKQ